MLCDNRILTIHIFLRFLWRNEYENIAISREKLDQFIQEKLPGYKINPAAGNGMCMLHAFHKGINNALGNAIPLNENTTNLRKEFLTNNKSYVWIILWWFCQRPCRTRKVLEWSSEILHSSQTLPIFFSLPLAKSTMLILSFTNQTQNESIKLKPKNVWLYKWRTSSKVTLYFAKTLSEYIDPILPVPFSNLDDDIEIIAFVPGNDVFPDIDIKQENDTTDDDSVVMVEELFSSVLYTRTEVKSEAGKWHFSLFGYFCFHLKKLCFI